jgi:hypothetical protein
MKDSILTCPYYDINEKLDIARIMIIFSYKYIIFDKN